jgi:hypothetical protein
MAIDQISTANTFEEWLTTTSTLVAVANNLTDNTGGGFVMNSSIFIEGSAASLNVRTLANINELTVNTISILGGSVTGNLETVNVTSNLYVGKDAFIHGNLTISGNVTLDSLGFDDLSVAGSVNSTNLNTSTANITLLTGTSNTAIYNTITAAIDSSIAFAIALG